MRRIAAAALAVASSLMGIGAAATVETIKAAEVVVDLVYSSGGKSFRLPRRQRYKAFKPRSNPRETPAWRKRQTNEAARRRKALAKRAAA